MTLKQWQQRSGEVPVYNGTYDSLRTVVFCDSLSPGYRLMLWRLDDYTVTSVSGGSIWLTRKD